MPIAPPKRRVSDTENKLRILLCLDALGMATKEELWPFLAHLELMDYLPFCLLLEELAKTGAVQSGRHALAGCLYVTHEGHRLQRLFETKVLFADRERIAAAAPAYRATLRLHKQVRSVYEGRVGDASRVSLTLCEGDVPTLLIRLTTADGALAHKAVEGFAGFAPKLLQMLYALPVASAPLLPAVSQAQALASARPGAPALCAFGGAEHAAVVSAACAKAQCTVLLLLPSAQAACGWAHGADALGEALAQALTALIEGAEVQP